MERRKEERQQKLQQNHFRFWLGDPPHLHANLQFTKVDACLKSELNKNNRMSNDSRSLLEAFAATMKRFDSLYRFSLKALPSKTDPPEFYSREAASFPSFK